MDEQVNDSGRAATLSRLDHARFLVGHLLPVYLQGLFTRSRFWVTVVSALHPDPLAVRLVSRLRRKYNARLLWLESFGDRTLLVLDPAGIRRVLDHSPAIYADPEAKRRGMSRFQPDALTISRGFDWRERRRFNESVLDSGTTPHRFAEHFLATAAREVDALQHGAPAQQRWKHFARLFERCSLAILFGTAAADDTYLTRTLTRLMRNGNRSRVLPPRRALFESFYQALRGYLRWPAANSLAALCRDVPSAAATRVENQVTHWMFALNETLAANVVRALLLIAAHPEVHEQVSTLLADTDLDNPRDVARLGFLEGCLQEAMRLWPTTPMLSRQTLADDVLGGEPVPRNTRVLILNSFNHRDRETHDFADRFSPQTWQETPIDYHFNHLSNGTQVCAGKNLALLLGTAVLARLLQGKKYTLVRPRLNPDRPLPHALNYFRACLRCEPRT